MLRNLSINKHTYKTVAKNHTQPYIKARKARRQAICANALRRGNIHRSYILRTKEVIAVARGDNPNSRKALENSREKTQFCGESAVKAAKKKHENEVIMKALCDDLRERCTEERIARMNESIITRAEHGDLNAYKLIRDGLGENPAKKVDLAGNGQVEYILSWGDGPKDYSETEHEVLKQES